MGQKAYFNHYDSTTTFRTSCLSYVAIGSLWTREDLDALYRNLRCSRSSVKCVLFKVATSPVVGFVPVLFCSDISHNHLSHLSLRNSWSPGLRFLDDRGTGQSYFYHSRHMEKCFCPVTRFVPVRFLLNCSATMHTA